MTLASYNEREWGHTGHFFSWHWGALGAARGGDAASQSFIGNTRWFVELERRYDGGFVHQFQLNNMDLGSFTNWRTTGSRLLQFCLPRKKLYITGKEGFSMAAITAVDLQEIVAAGRFDPDQRNTAGDLLEARGRRPSRS